MPEPTPPAPSPTSPAALAGQAVALWRRLPARGRAAAIAAVVAIVGVVGFLWLRPGPEPWPTVVEQLTPIDATELAATLAQRGIPHRLGPDGRSIEVPSTRLAEARVAAASAGLPRRGVGFELFDRVKLGQSSFAEQVNYRRALEGELARSIAALAPVETARVHLALGRRSVLKDADQPPTASVAVRLRPEQRLTPEQVDGIRQLVASSLDGLVASQVVVVDQHGTPLGGDDGERGKDAADLERQMAATVRTLLERTLGPGRVEVVARVEVDRSKVTQSEELYDPTATALRSENRIGPAAVGGTPAPVAGGVIGVQGNLPGAPAPTVNGGTAVPAPTTEQRNFEVSRTIRQTESDPMRVRRVQLAILVDHRPGPDGKPIAPTAAELEMYAALAKTAAGLDDSRGDRLEIRAMPFVDEGAAPTATRPAARPTWLPLAVGGGALALGLIIAGLVWRRRRAKAKAEATPTIALPAPVAEVERALETPNAGALPAPTERPAEVAALEQIGADLPRAARVLSAWLAEALPPPAAAPAASKHKAA
jgi:flagellar M-ring protein FliF